MNRQFLHTRLWLLSGLLALCATALTAQNRSARETALVFLQESPSKFELTQNDVSDVQVVREYRTRHNGMTHVWVQQQYKGIPVFNGLFGLHVKPNGEVMHLGHRFINGIQQRVNTTLPSMSAGKALEMAMNNIGFTGFPAPKMLRKENEQNMLFEGGAVSRNDIPVSAAYMPVKDGSVRLAWRMVIDQANTPDYWTIVVDAQTGAILDKLNHTSYCNWGEAHRSGETCTGHDHAARQDAEEKSAMDALLLDETYNVFALPLESPIHGNRSIVTDPADPASSPYGWHDVDGATGAEFTYTRGNNVWAFDDIANDDTPEESESVEGGSSLNFDYNFDINAEPLVNKDAAITNLFYINNMVHDIFYRYGFDEESGNFQANNYGHGGVDGDEVYAQALDGSGTDNANFATPQDGGNGRMQMYVWNLSSLAVVANSPAPVIGLYGAQEAAGWGGPFTNVPLTGDVVFVTDGTAEANYGCQSLINDVAGKIAMVDRGGCEFGRKALNAQQAGAIACIVCNFDNTTIAMGVGAVGGQVTIPVAMMSSGDCNILREYAGSGLNLSLKLQDFVGPQQRDGDFDNGIIAHEYHHGISNRLTGDGFSCLGNVEQMGEGWSDFASLILTVEPGDKGTDKRGIGNYALYKEVDAVGIRRYPYSTDMSIAPLTYKDMGNSAIPHGVGEIWANMLWDLYWAMVEKYGYDADLNNTNSGNYRAVQLVVDGMKLQPCNPGFIDGRNAIMEADIANYNGVDTCLISSVFARRGLGYYADQGTNGNAADGIANFDPIPPCTKELKIKKITTTPLITAGDDVAFEITLTNYKDETLNNVVLTDEVPAGLSFSGADNGGVFSNGIVQWNVGTLTTGQARKFTYTAKSSTALGSHSTFHDLMETEAEWYSDILDQTTGEIFTLQSNEVHPGSGNFAWAGNDVAVESNYSLETTYEFNVSGTNPVFRVWHKYDTETGADGGFLEFRDVDLPLNSWKRIPASKVFRGGYIYSIQYGTFAIPYLDAFTGNSNGWIQSYFDLSEFSGKNITVRFRFGSDDNTGGDAWYIDELEAIDMFNYDGEACVTADGVAAVCARAPGRGVIVEPVTVGTKEPSEKQLPMLVQPNPASDFLYISLNEALKGQVNVSLVSAEGRTVQSVSYDGVALGQVLSMDVQNLPAGVYSVRLQSAAGHSVQKVVVH